MPGASSDTDEVFVAVISYPSKESLAGSVLASRLVVVMARNATNGTAVRNILRFKPVFDPPRWTLNSLESGAILALLVYPAALAVSPDEYRMRAYRISAGQGKRQTRYGRVLDDFSRL
jgi:hypothetical protein